MIKPWKCHAKPASLNGKTCGHQNVAGRTWNRLLCCESCGATKIASDLRAKP